jgi:hypothetical protein
MKKILTLILITLGMLYTAEVCSQNVLTGSVVDDATGEPLIGANVTAENTGTITDFDGIFSITLPEGVNEVTFSYVGYTS